MGKASISNRRLSRILSMDRRELFDRLRQSITARADVLRYRRAPDFINRSTKASWEPTGHFFFTPKQIPSLCAALKQAFPEQAEGIVLQAEKACQHRFDLLGYKALDYGQEIDWHADVVHGKRGPRKPWFKVRYLDFSEVGDSKITWELNRHQHFVTLAKAYCLTGDDKFALEIFAQWKHWHQVNPYPIGLNWASSLEVGYRSLAWVWTFFLLQECPLFTPGLRKSWQDALRLSGRHIETYLSTYFSPNTHLLGEALALFFVGTLFPSFPSAARWRQRGWDILQREAARQVRDDGFYFEQSTYYHVYALDILLHARVLAGLNGVPWTSGFDETLQRMLDALCSIGRAGVVPNLGDDDGGRLFDPHRNRAEHMLDPLATGAVMYHRGDFKFAAGGPREETLWLLGVQGLEEFDSLAGTEPSRGSSALLDSGFYLLTDEKSGEQLLIDAGPLGSGNGGHGHADALSISLVRNGRNLLIDPGTFEYVGEGNERASFRGTRAHNTLCIDGSDQAVSTGPFSWKDFPRVQVERWITGRQFALFQGSHDGYSRLRSPVLHRRWVFHKKGEFWLVRDLAEGHGSHQLGISWHLAPALSEESSGRFRSPDEQTNVTFVTAEGHDWSQSTCEESWSPVYGCQERSQVIRFGTLIELPADFATLVISDDSSQNAVGRLLRINKGVDEGVAGYRYSDAWREHSFFFANGAGPWELEGWVSDADFLYWSVDRERECSTLILCDGSYADAGGRRVLTGRARVNYAEILNSRSGRQIYSSDLHQIVPEQSPDQLWPERDFMVTGNDPKGMGV